MISVVVAAEMRLLSHLLADALNVRFGIQVAATASTAARAAALAAGLAADVVLVSMRMADAGELVRALLESGSRVVTLGPCDQEPVAIVEDGTLHDLVAAIHGVMHGAFSSAPPPAPGLEQLTPTERRVLRAVNEGRSNKEIAGELGMAVPTVKHHVHSLLQKLGVRRRGEAAAVLRGANRPSWRSRPSRPLADRSSSAG